MNIKRVLGLLFVTIFAFTIQVQTVHAFSWSGLLNSLSSNIKSSLGASVVPIISPTTTPTADLTPRIAYWWGKVNQHVDIATSQWVTDPDGSSGANLDKLAYCKKFYPNTTSVADYQTETISSWMDAGNVNNYSLAVLTTKCIDTPVVVPTPALTTNNIIFTNPVSSTVWYTDGTGEVNVPGQLGYPISFGGTVAKAGATYSMQLINTRLGITINFGSGGTLSNTTNNIGYGTVYFNPILIKAFANAGDYQIKLLFDDSSIPSVYSAQFSIQVPVAPAPIPVITVLDPTPRIAYWGGKVNQHTDFNGTWQTDTDGTSGANLDKVTYCQKFFPGTTSTTPYQSETITTWKRAAGYEQSDYTNTVTTDKCVQGLDTTPRIAYWWGKVNQHTDAQGNWQTDIDGTSGASLDKLTYCKKFYPNTTNISDYKTETLVTWKRAAGYEQSNYVNTALTTQCLGGVAPTATPTSTTVTTPTTPINSNLIAPTTLSTPRVTTPTTTPIVAPTAVPATSTPVVTDTSCNAHTFTKLLKFGMKGADVDNLQLILNDQGFLADSDVSGYFSLKTRTALKAFQKANGITQTGTTGPLTRAKLNDLWVSTQCNVDQTQG